MLNRLSTLVVAALLVGCVDPKSRLDDFENRVVDGAPDAPPVTCGDAGPTPDINGKFLFGGIGSQGQMKDIAFLVTIEFRPNPDGSGSADLSMQPLKVSDRSPTGDPIVAKNQPINTCGRFMDVPILGLLPGDADPVIPDFPLNLDVKLEGGFVTEDFACGSLAGKANTTDVSGPFALQRVKGNQPLPDSKHDCTPP